LLQPVTLIKLLSKTERQKGTGVTFKFAWLESEICR